MAQPSKYTWKPRGMKARRRGIVAASLLLATMTVPVAGVRPGQAQTAPPAGPVLLRDAEAGRWTHGVTMDGVQPDTTVEPTIAVDPDNPLHAVAGYQAGRIAEGAAAINGFATTFDGGRTWTHGELPKLTVFNGGTYERASDPVIAFGPGGIVHYNSLVINFTKGGSAVFNSTSHDGGRTWDDPVFVSNVTSNISNDKNWITVDNSDAPGHHKGRVYVAWYSAYLVVVSYSDDEGKTWSPPFTAAKGIGAVPTVLPNGDLAIVYLADSLPVTGADPGNGNDLPEPVGEIVRFGFVTAPGAGSVPTGGPLVFGPSTYVASYQGKTVRAQRAGPFIPLIDVDQRTGRIYVAWSDNRYRTDGVNDPVLAYSDNSGLTWSAPVRIYKGPTDDWVNRYNNAIAVGKDGVVRVAYRQRQEAPTEDAFSPYVDTYYQESTDGTTWSEPVRVNSVRTDVRFAAFSRNGAFFGEYHQIATSGDLTYIVRCEAFQVQPGEPAAFPPQVYHQRTWVAVLGRSTSPAGGAGTTAGNPASGGGGGGSPTPAPSGRLPATGAPPHVAVAALVLVVLAFAARREGRNPRRP